MTDKNEAQGTDLLTMATDIVAAYVTNNRVSTTELPGLLSSVHAALSGIIDGTGVEGSETKAEKVEPLTAAQIRKSVRPDGIVSFIDGKAYKTMKRHLTKHGLDPYSYRAKFGLPAEYPMTSAAYSEARSALAKNIGLGRPGRAAA